MTSFLALAQADHHAGLGELGGIAFLDPLQQAQRMVIAGAGADLQIEPRHGFQIVVEDVRAGVDDHVLGPVLAQEVRGQDFDRRARRGGADRR
jgi:hypothetical protein